jgi:hypothetical protein
MHSLFFQLYLLQLLQTMFLVLLKEQNLPHPFDISLMTLLIYPISGSWVWNAEDGLQKWDLRWPVQV